jgi:NTE family protein
MRALWGGLPAGLSPGHLMSQALRGVVSPYQANPLNINPLRALLEEAIDFQAIHRQRALKVFVSATHVTTGKAVVFGGAQLNVDAVLASACLPLLFQAVEIDGEAYWDGGFSVNPALSPLISQCGCADLVLVQINPLRRSSAPRAAHEILDRINELTFNASLLTQMRSIDFVNRLLAEGSLPASRGKQVLVHRIDGGAAMAGYPSSTRGSADSVLIGQLFAIGQAAAREWLAAHHGALGHHGTVDIRRDYLDDTRLMLPATRPGAPPHATGFRPWLARLLRRSAR